MCLLVDLRGARVSNFSNRVCRSVWGQPRTIWQLHPFSTTSFSPLPTPAQTHTHTHTHSLTHSHTHTHTHTHSLTLTHSRRFLETCFHTYYPGLLGSVLLYAMPWEMRPAWAIVRDRMPPGQSVPEPLVRPTYSRFVRPTYSCFVRPTYSCFVRPTYSCFVRPTYSCFVRLTQTRFVRPIPLSFTFSSFQMG
jgi:hypothetical protein